MGDRILSLLLIAGPLDLIDDSEPMTLDQHVGGCTMTAYAHLADGWRGPVEFPHEYLDIAGEIAGDFDDNDDTAYNPRTWPRCESPLAD